MRQRDARRGRRAEDNADTCRAQGPLRKDREEEDDEKWMTSLFISPFIPFDDSNSEMGSEETDPDSREESDSLGSGETRTSPPASNESSMRLEEG